MAVYGSSVACVAVAFSSYDALPYDWMFRPLLNLSWGFLFGSSIWAAFVQGHILRRKLPKQVFSPIQGKCFNLFFKASSLMSAVLFLTTVGLAPRNFLLIRSSLFCWSTILLNSLYLIPRTSILAEEMLQRELEYNIGTTKTDKAEDIEAANKDERLKKLKREFRIMHGCSIVLSYVSVSTLLPYVFV